MVRVRIDCILLIQQALSAKVAEHGQLDAILFGQECGDRLFDCADRLEFATQGVTILQVTGPDAGNVKSPEIVAASVEAVGDANGVPVPAVDVTGDPGDAEAEVLVEPVVPTAIGDGLDVVDGAAEAGNVLR